jgi:hypothetical protein
MDIPELPGARHVIYVPFNRDIVIATPKCGQTSVRNAGGPHHQVPIQNVQYYERVIAFIRDPLERLESAWNYFSATFPTFPSAWIAKQKRMKVLTPATLELFINLILDDGWVDKHWYPQSALWKVEPTDVIPFEDFNETMIALGRTPKHDNPSKGEKTGITHRVPELEEFYKEDFNRRKDAEEDKRRKGAFPGETVG